VCYIELSGYPMTVLRGLPTWRASYQIENPRIPTHVHFDATRFRHPIAPSMDELHRLADDVEWFLQAVALGVLRRKAEQGDREASFQPRGQYVFEVEPGSGEWLQIGNEYALRSNGLPGYYREQIVAAVRRRLAALGPHQMLLLAALMRHYQHRVYQPRLEADETGAQLPAPSLPHMVARRVAEAWLARACALLPEAGPGALERAAATLGQWSEPVPGSAADAYPWEVQAPAEKRVPRPEVLASDAQAAAVCAAAAPVAGARYKVFQDGCQQGPYPLDELARRVRRGEVARATRVWNMAWDPRSAQWRTAGDELAGLFEHAVPDPDDGIPDPE
jgi:hypothetical protein